MTAEVRPGYVYRYFDRCEPGCLLYVGTTLNPRGRGDQHHAGSPWHDLAGPRIITEFATQIEAFDAESAAIRDEAPAFNRNVPGIRWAERATEAQRRVSAYQIAHPAVALPEWPWAR